MTKALLPSILWSLVILVLSAMPGINLPKSFWDIISMDKLGHLGVYGIQTFLLLVGLSSQIPNDAKKVAVIALIISILYGTLMEVMQYTFFPYRYFDYLDIIANIIGSFTGLLIFKIFNTKKHD